MWLHHQFSCEIRYKKWGIIHVFSHCLRVASAVSSSCAGHKINGRKIPSTFAAYFKMNIIAMQKSEYISMPKTGKTGRNVNLANMKVSGANAQSRPSGILIAHAIGKLCFALLTPFSAAQNNLPRSLAAGGRNALRSRRFIWKNFDRKQALCIASPLKSFSFVP
jgi:hypothetical protein